jgi:hypothetical protein
MKLPLPRVEMKMQSPTKMQSLIFSIVTGDTWLGKFTACCASACGDRPISIHVDANAEPAKREERTARVSGKLGDFRTVVPANGKNPRLADDRRIFVPS